MGFLHRHQGVRLGDTENQRRTVLLLITVLSGVVCLLAAVGSVFGSEVVPQLFNLACHQNPERCLVVAGIPMALCVRCFAIFAGLFIGSGMALISAPSRHRALRFLLFAVVLTVLDVSSETVGLYTNVIMVRLVTGWLLGSAIALMIGSQEDPQSNASILPSSTPVQT
ncbi:MAG: hypothetical protein DRP71_03160 [Verrucomicrobia bacterium]|nr:MAG: hypothetical protein DRP71_03160 [Verrucomicrobiota bacterium]